MTMKPVFTIDDIRSWKPCYDPARFLPEGWSGTALDILAVEDVQPMIAFGLYCEKKPFLPAQRDCSRSPLPALRSRWWKTPTRAASSLWMSLNATPMARLPATN